VTISKEIIPLADTNSNKLRTQVKASLDANMTNLSVEKLVDAKGLVKNDIIDETLALTPYMENDYRNYDGMSMWEGLGGRQEEKATADFNELKKQWKEEKPEMMKAMAETEYGFKIEKYNNFRVVQDGRAYKKRNLQYSENFVLGDVTSKAGEDLLIALPALVTQQTKIKKDERNRTMPIDVRFPRTLTWSIIFTIPSGYAVKGIENLNQNISNDYAAFSSVARVENNTLTIDISKMYKTQHFDAQQWPKMLEVLEAAYNFSQSKIVLRKQ
jgi:hypothetical protein